MAERKSPPGPREMVQEHKVINTFSGIQFGEEGESLDKHCPTCGSVDPGYVKRADGQLRAHDKHWGDEPCPDPFHAPQG